MFGFKKDKHQWKPLGQPLLTHRLNEEGKQELYIFVVEFCKKTGTYRYIRVPSNKQLAMIESKD